MLSAMTIRPLPVLHGERVVLRPVRDDDLAPLLAMLVEPDVARWFGRWDAARVQRDLLDPQDDEVGAGDRGGGRGRGRADGGEEEEPDYRCVSIDLGARRPRTRAAASGPRRCGS